MRQPNKRWEKVVQESWKKSVIGGQVMETARKLEKKKKAIYVGKWKEKWRKLKRKWVAEVWKKSKLENVLEEWKEKSG